jgi:histidinol-phosphate aminotransferase
MKELINPNVLELTPYRPGKPVEEIQRVFNLDRVIKLASNENPFPLPPYVVEAINREVSMLNMYPCSDSYYLRNRIADYNGVSEKNIVVGAGSVELIRMIVKAFLNPGKGGKVLTSEKTFVMYKIAAVEEGGKQALVEVPLGEDYGMDLERMYRLVDRDTRIIFIANPNNPTGTLLSKKELMDFIDKIPRDIMVVLDNAYQEYVTDAGGEVDYLDAIEMAVSRKNVVVLRTFSKIYALAGLRIGYAVSNEALISYLARIKIPFNVTRVAQAAALASLQDDDFKIKSAALNVKNREELFRQLTQMGLKVVPSKANFLLFFPPADIEALNQRLLKEGVIIRPLQAFGIPDGMRVTIGSEKDNEFFVEKLKKVLK